MADAEKLKVSRAIVVEGRDDVTAVTAACDALVIPTHGYGITRETWEVIGKAYDEKGIIILTDPDHAGENIRKKLTEKFPDALQCWLARDDAYRDGDIGIENAAPEDIREALLKTLERSGEAGSASCTSEADAEDADEEAVMADIVRLGLTGTDGASELRAAVCKELGIGSGNAKAMLKKLKGFGIGRKQLEEAVIRTQEQR